ncbi:MAG: tol-pal system protein YbgF [Desulfuromonadaceae bacterium]|nr:tol-pal system protein YbgF [Desulfuromonas sp.]MDY0185071.1 tol-pal system protein YbgF [Desulfuromonadaceae bacterium]
MNAGTERTVRAVLRSAGVFHVFIAALVVSGCATGPAGSHRPALSGPLEYQVEKQQLRITAIEQQLATMSAAQRQQEEHDADLMERMDAVLAEVAQIRAAATNARGARNADDVIMRRPQDRIDTADAAGTLAKTQTPTEIYRRAFAAYTTGKHAQAQELFETFATSFPDNDYVANARFWQGEASLAQGLYPEAQKAFAAVIEFDPHGSKVPFARLKQGVILLQQGDKLGARTILEDVQRNYPKTEAATQAATVLNSGRLN